MNQSRLFTRCAPLALMTLVIASSSAAAAEQDRVIRGRVMDAANHPLVGAAVLIQPGNLTVVTDRDGLFVSPELAMGAYTLEVLYMGYDTFTQKVTIGEGPAVNLAVKLKPAAHSAKTITVKATRLQGEVEAINQEKNALNIVNVLPHDVITSLPNANVADAIGRLPSVSLERDEGEGKFIQVRGLESRYTSVSINGVRVPSTLSGQRSIKLDAFPSDLLGTIELHKTVSADQEGDAIGGSVNLVTKTAPDKPVAEFGVEGGYNPQAGGRYSRQVNATYAGRFGASDALGFVIGGSYDFNGRSINDIEPTPAVVTLPDNSTKNAFTDIDLRDYRYERKRYGFAGGLDYRLDDHSVLYIRGLFSQFQNYGDRWVTSIAAETYVTPITTDNSGSYSGTVQNRRPNEQTYSISAGGKHDLASVVLDYSLSYSHAQLNAIGAQQASYDGINGLDAVVFTVDSSDGNYPRFTPTNLPAGVSPLDPKNYQVKKFSISDQESGTKSTAFEVNALLPYGGGKLKMGLKYRDEEKTNYSNNRTFSATGAPALTLDLVPSDWSDPKYYFGRYQMGPFPQLSAINDWFASHPTALKEYSAAKEHNSNDAAIWTAKEKVAAAYLKNTSQFDASQLEVGLRLERTETAFNANQVNRDASGNWTSTVPIAASKDYSNILPSASWRYELDHDTILRVVCGMALARPDYSQMVPSTTVSDNNTATKRQLSAGNPDLKPTKAVNYDLLFEHYLSPLGLLSAGVFYKDLRDPIYAGSTSIVVGGPFDGYQKNQPINGPKASVYGFEIAYKQHLTFLPGALSGLGVDTNYTHTTSKATFDPSTGRTGTASLQRTAPDEFNFGVTYDWHAFSVRMAATYNSAMIFSYNFSDGADGGLTGPNGDTYLYAHTQIDAQASYAFANGLKITASVLNLTNQVFGFYNGSTQWNIQREFYDRTYSVGLKYTW